MTKLEYLSQFSNAVLSPELNTCEIPLPKHGTGWASIFDHNQGELKECEIEFRKKWCEEQIELIGEFGAVLGGCSMKDLNKVLMFVFMAIGAALVKWGGV